MMGAGPCDLLAYSMRVLIATWHKLGIEPVFGGVVVTQLLHRRQ
jgi:hypothetical protein